MRITSVNDPFRSKPAHPRSGTVSLQLTLGATQGPGIHAQLPPISQRIVTLAHTDGLKIFAATLTPFQGARYWTPRGEAKREAVNHWIQTAGAFDGVIDFAKVLADPANPQRLDPAYDSGDHLHPNDAGYRAMADALSLAMLKRNIRRAG